MFEMPKSYEPTAVEEKWGGIWFQTSRFQADPFSSKPPFSIVIPPPNVTGVLHLGHVLNSTIQDALCRRARMLGYEVLWLPGTDHAGIATQTAVERFLRETQGVKRHEMGREKFLEAVWEWKEKHGGLIIQQLKRLGCSCDWSRERFTMDPDYSRTVLQAFVDLYREGLIYRGKRMVNWCPASLTALSDEEVVMKANKGFLYIVRYEVLQRPGVFLEIATTRPETVMGDTAVAVHPEDPRYQDFIGLCCLRPFPRAPIPIIADTCIDRAFGTGVLKVTPAHDKADYAISQRHRLEVINILHPDGRIDCQQLPQLDGLDRFQAREKAVRMLRAAGLLARVEPYENYLGYSERANVPVESRLSRQWFLRYPAVHEALEAVRNGAVRFFPSQWVKVYEHWMENIQDWCISRQLWWGHRIPAWYREDGEVYVGLEPPTGLGNWQQDPDVLDTWFSSWLWPFATMDAHTHTKFFPTTVLSTGFDILFFWVARMLMAGYRFMGKKPFTNVVIHGLIRDSKGRKMSKTLGNSPDSLALLEKYGADGVRFGLLHAAPVGQDVRFDEKQLEEGRNFSNKLWNAARFRQMQGPLHCRPICQNEFFSPADICIAIMAKLDNIHQRVASAWEAFHFQEVTDVLYDFLWSSYCDEFIEAAKPHLRETGKRDMLLRTMDHLLSNILLLLHPIMPYITEELWSLLGFSQSLGPSILIASLPKSNFLPYRSEQEKERSLVVTTRLYQSAHIVRGLRAEFKIPSNKLVQLLVQPAFSWNSADQLAFASLVKAETIETVSAPPKGAAGVITSLGEFFIPLLETDVVSERRRLLGEINRAEVEISKAKSKLENTGFISRAPDHVVSEYRAREADWKKKKEILYSYLSSMR